MLLGIVSKPIFEQFLYEKHYTLAEKQADDEDSGEEKSSVDKFKSKKDTAAIGNLPLNQLQATDNNAYSNIIDESILSDLYCKKDINPPENLI